MSQIKSSQLCPQSILSVPGSFKTIPNGGVDMIGTGAYQRLLDLAFKYLKKEVKDTSQSEAARRIGVSPSLVNRYESGQRGQMTMDTLFQVLARLRVPMSEIMEAIDPENGKLFVELSRRANKKTLEMIVAVLSAESPTEFEKDLEYHYRKAKKPVNN